MPARVLVIDDSPMLVELAVKAFNAAGFRADGAMDLATLEQHLARGPVDVILVDINMPEIFGDDVVEFLRSQRQLDCKFVLFSDINESELAERARSAGADAFVSKSRGIDAAIEQVRALVGSVNPTEPPAMRTGKRVLVVDDSETTAMLLQAELSAKGFEVLTADTAEKATKIILKKKTRPNLVLLDVRMPQVNGEQLCRFIKGNSLFSGIKVLLCSSENIEELKRICRDAGADGYVTKDSVLTKVLQKELAT